ncbi:MAG: hypothetical protein AAGI54_08315 [Planctomycetota bacterium]
MPEPETRRDDEPPDISLDELMDMVDAQRDAELAGQETPPLKRSWIKRQQLKAAAIIIPGGLLLIVLFGLLARFVVKQWGADGWFTMVGVPLICVAGFTTFGFFWWMIGKALVFAALTAVHRSGSSTRAMKNVIAKTCDAASAAR